MHEQTRYTGRLTGWPRAGGGALEAINIVREAWDPSQYGADSEESMGRVMGATQRSTTTTTTTRLSTLLSLKRWVPVWARTCGLGCSVCERARCAESPSKCHAQPAGWCCCSLTSTSPDLLRLYYGYSHCTLQKCSLGCAHYHSMKFASQISCLCVADAALLPLFCVAVH
jgi:hypothetical protein